MPSISVAVSGTPSPDGGSGTYSSGSNQVSSNGNINVNPQGITTITFSRGANQTWSFASPWVTLDPTTGPFTVVAANCSASQIVLQDNDENKVHGRASYEYTLHTDDGNFDPTILNKGKS